MIASNKIHVEPINDLIAHEDSDECACLPTTELIQTDHGDEYLIVHNAWDGRE